MRIGHLLPALILVLLSHLGAVPLKADEPLRVGVAETELTPPKGFPMAGYYHERLATGTHDPLKARAIVFRNGPTDAALVICDLTGIARDLAEEVRRRASGKTGIPAAHIVISATHSHTAPDYTRDLYEYLRKTSIRAENKQRYAGRLIESIVEAITTAHDRAQPAIVAAGTARQKVPVSFNRRFVMKDGSVRTWMRLDDPNVVRAAGPIDPEIGMLLVRSAKGDRPLGLLRA
jgi:hypothetical protein